MKLIELEPVWLMCKEHGWHESVALTAAQADGIRFLCPKCYRAGGGVVGVHSIVCWFVDRVPADALPGPGRWRAAGGDFTDLTLAPSIHLTSEGCGWHGFVAHGEVIDA